MAQMNPEDDPRKPAPQQMTPTGPNTGSHAPNQAVPPPAQPRAGSNRDQVTPLGPGVVDRSAFNYGGSATGAQDAAAKLTDQGIHGQARAGEQIDVNNANQDRAAAGDARGAQLRMADMIAQRAMGRTPSIAGMRADQDMNRAAAEQTSAAASARGPAGLALAQQGAAANTAGAQGAISNSAQINSANERMQAEQNATGAYANLRGGDMQQQGQDFSQSLSQSQLNAAQRAQNDQYQIANQGQAIGVQGMQLGADMNRDAAEQSGHFNAAGLQEQKNAAHDSSVMGWTNTAISGASAVVGVAGMVSDERTKNIEPWKSTGASAGMNAAYGSATSVPPEANANPELAPPTWGTGAGTTGLDMQKMIAHRALEAQSDQAQAAHLDSQIHGGGPQAFEQNMGALKRRDSEDLGLMQAKTRNGVELSKDEEVAKGALQHRVGADKVSDAKAASADAKPAADAAKKPDAAGGAKAISGSLQEGLGGVQKALSQMADKPAPTWHPSGPATYAMPQALAPVTWSDERTKDIVPLRDESDGRGEMHYDRDVTSAPAKSKLSNADGSDSNTPKPKPVRVAASKASGPRKLSDAELKRMGEEMLGSLEVQKTAQLGAGPSTGGMGRALMTSDANAKRQAFIEGVNHATDAANTGTFGPIPDYADTHKPSVVKSNGPPAERRAGQTVVDRSDRDAQNATNRHTGRELAKADVASMPGMGGTLNGAGAIRQDEIADEQQQRANARHTTRPRYAQPQSFTRDDPMAEANRAMAAQPYSYKPEFAAMEGQAPGEKNVGPMAQKMAADPVASTAVKEDPNTGLLGLDVNKTVKLTAGGVAALQKQNDEQDAQIASMAKMIAARRGR